MGILFTEEKRKASLSASMARNVARRADIGEIPPVVDMERRMSCNDNLLKFGYTYFSGLLPRSPSPMLIEYIRRMQVTFMEGGRMGIAIPRGYGKSMWAKIGLIWAAVYGWSDFSVIFGATQPHADAIIAEIRFFLETYEILMEDFPEVCYPIKCIDGKIQRLAGQTYLGERTRMVLSVDEIVMPTIPGSKASGAIIIGRGITSGFLGLVRGGKRPKIALLDDVQTRESAESMVQTLTREKIVQGGVLGLGGHDRPISVLMTCTVIKIGDLSDRYMDPDLHPEFFGIRKGMVKAWPDKRIADHHWEEYAALWKMDQRNGDESRTLANEYYRNNRIEMDAGSLVEDDELFDKRYEQSAIQHAYNCKLTLGESAFQAEMQNSPIRDTNISYEIDSKIVLSRLNGYKRFATSPNHTMVFAFADVGYDKIRWCVTAFSKMQSGMIIDYGQYPERGILVPKNSTDFDQKRLVIKGLMAVHEILDKIVIVTPQGKVCPIKAWGVDRGFQPESVHYFANNTRSRFSILPQKGYSSTQYKPYGKDMVGEPGNNCHVTESKYGQMLSVHVSFFKELVQRGFLVEPQSPGSCSLWGSSISTHMEMAEHICSEILTDKATGNNGVTFYKWDMRPGTKNHLFDALVGTYGLASWFRVFKDIDRSIHENVVGGGKQVVTKPPVKREKRVCTVKLEEFYET